MKVKNIKGIILLTVLLVASVTSYAAENLLAVADVAKKESLHKKNTVLPPLFSQKYEYHRVCGCCEKDVQCDMMQKAIRWRDGNSYDSITKWKMKWDYGYNYDSTYCYADSFRIKLDIIIQIPRWICLDNSASQSLRDKWGVYIEKLISHESAHCDLARQAVEEINREVSQLPPARSCGELDHKVQTVCQERMKKLDQDQQSYDEATGHGFAGSPSFP
jgi:predicted secreted Zn-dependent protease